MTGRSGCLSFTLRSSVSPSIPGMLMRDRITIRVDSMPPHQLLQPFLARIGEVHGIGSPLYLTTEALFEQLGDIALVIDYQNANHHAASLTVVRRGRQIVNSV